MKNECDVCVYEDSYFFLNENIELLFPPYKFCSMLCTHKFTVYDILSFGMLATTIIIISVSLKWDSYVSASLC